MEDLDCNFLIRDKFVPFFIIALRSAIYKFSKLNLCFKLIAISIGSEEFINTGFTGL
jgi:hypothetical protein